MTMTTRKTSREAYEHLVDSNLLRGKQSLIIRHLVVLGDATSGEAIDAIAAERPDDRSLRNVNAWRARFTELQARGLIVEAGERECAVTGRRAIVWRFTGRTKPLKVTRVRRGAKAWKALAMDLWTKLRNADILPDDDRVEIPDRIRALGGHP
jgi:hypothetical protein